MTKETHHMSREDALIMFNLALRMALRDAARRNLVVTPEFVTRLAQARDALRDGKTLYIVKGQS